MYWQAYFINFGANTAITSVLIFIPLIARDYGANSVTIGAIAASYGGMLFLSSALFGRWADLTSRKLFIVLGLLLSSIAFFCHKFAYNIPSLFLIRCLTGLAVGIFPSAITAYVYKKNNNLGFFTASTSLGWGIGSIAAGMISDYQMLFMFAGACFIMTFFIAIFFLKQKYTYIEQSFFNTEVLKKNWRVYLVFFLRHSGACTIWVIYPLFLASLGANKLWIGIIYAFNAFSQVLFMPYLNRVKSERLIKIGLFASAATFTGFALCRNYYQILPFQILLAFSFSSLYLGSLKNLMEHNEEHSTVAGVFNAIVSLSGIVGALLGGVIGTFGYRIVILTAISLPIVGIFVFIRGARLSPCIKE